MPSRKRSTSGFSSSSATVCPSILTMILDKQEVLALRGGDVRPNALSEEEYERLLIFFCNRLSLHSHHDPGQAGGARTAGRRRTPKCPLGRGERAASHLLLQPFVPPFSP